MERITIIGTTPVGVSMGLALKSARLKNTEIVGTSGDKQALSTAAKMGAYDKTETMIRPAVEGAQLIVLDLPFSEMREMLEAIGPIVDDGCVITDTSTTKTRVMEWAEAMLPKGISFVGGRPLLKREHSMLEDATANLFQGIDYCVMPGLSADQQAVKTVIGFIELINAKPLFLDPHEHDSYASAMDLLSIVMSSAFTRTMVNSESWREMHKLAGETFAHYSQLASTDPLDNEAACLANSESLAHWIDQMIGALIEFRDQIKEHDDKLIDTFIKVWEYRARWEANAMDDPDGPMLPSASESMATAFFGDRIVKRFQSRKGEDEKSSRWKYSRKN